MAATKNRAGRLAVLLAAVLLVAGGTTSAKERGAELYSLCSQCHGAAGAGNPATLAPSIAGLPEWYVEGQLQKFRGGLRGTHFDDIAGMRMRPMALWLRSDDDVKAVAAYVASLPRTAPAATLEGGNAAKGDALFVVCKTCHGADAAGNPQMFAPPLRGATDWYLLKQLKKFKGGVRGFNPTDQNGIVMAGMAKTLPDEQAMKDVIAYIMTLPK
jgi:cytochrome c oxidase subunit 2